MFHFHPIHKKMSETCQKLAFTHPVVVLKSGLKNNWMKKLDSVNGPLWCLQIGILKALGRLKLRFFVPIQCFTLCTTARIHCATFVFFGFL